MEQNLTEIENTSGKGKYAKVPKEIEGWNWGGFLLTWIWGLANGTPIALLALVPILNLGVAIYLGVYGNDLAWKNKYWYDTNDFKKTQKKWAMAGIIVTIIVVALIAFNIGLKVKEKKQSELRAAQIMEVVMQDAGARQIIGKDAEIIANFGRSYISFGNKIENESHDIAIRSENGIFFVKANIQEEIIISIEIHAGESNPEPKEKYIFHP